jgi:hypothetical protein
MLPKTLSFHIIIKSVWFIDFKTFFVTFWETIYLQKFSKIMEWSYLQSLQRCRDTQHTDIQHYDTQHDNIKHCTQHNNIKHNSQNEWCCVECPFCWLLLCWVSFLLSDIILRVHAEWYYSQCSLNLYVKSCNIECSILYCYTEYSACIMPCWVVLWRVSLCKCMQTKEYIWKHHFVWAFTKYLWKN